MVCQAGVIFNRVLRPPTWVLLLATLLPSAAPARAQGLPRFAPINPVAASRSGLFFLPYQEPRPGGWTISLALDYASTIEDNQLTAASYLLDSELLRLRLGVLRDLDRRGFLLFDVPLQGSYSGVLDGFLEWYHDLLGIEIPERERRPRDVFDYHVELPDDARLQRRPSDLFLGDLRLGAGLRARPWLQSFAAVTLPTATGPDGYGRGVVSFSLLNTARFPLSPPLLYEGSLGLGFTPSHGPLASTQRELMVAVSSGLRWRFWGRHSFYGNLFYHSPYYHDTTLPSLDRRDLSLDFGWILATHGGSEWRIGMAEDLEPGGPAVDLVFRFGAEF